MTQYFDVLYLTKIYKKNAQIGIVRQEYYYYVGGE